MEKLTPVIKTFDLVQECKIIVYHILDLSDRKKMYEKGRVPLEDDALKKLLRQASGLV